MHKTNMQKTQRDVNPCEWEMTARCWRCMHGIFTGLSVSLSLFESRCLVATEPVFPSARAKVHSIIHVETLKKMHPSWVVMFMPNRFS